MKSHLRILRVVYDNPGLTEPEIYRKLIESHWSARLLPKLLLPLFGRPQQINFNNDMADLEDFGLIRWEGVDPDWKYYPPTCVAPAA